MMFTKFFINIIKLNEFPVLGFRQSSILNGSSPRTACSPIKKGLIAYASFPLAEALYEEAPQWSSDQGLGSVSTTSSVHTCIIHKYAIALRTLCLAAMALQQLRVYFIVFTEGKDISWAS